jgi:hypothetical protein
MSDEQPTPSETPQSDTPVEPVLDESPFDTPQLDVIERGRDTLGEERDGN